MNQSDILMPWEIFKGSVVEEFTIIKQRMGKVLIGISNGFLIVVKKLLCPERYLCRLHPRSIVYDAWIITDWHCLGM